MGEAILSRSKLHLFYLFYAYILPISFSFFRFPYSEDKNYTILDYHIIDVTEDGEIMVVANHGPVLSNLYTSAKITPYEVQFSLSLERVMFYNPNVTWHDSWLAATAGMCIEKNPFLSKIQNRTSEKIRNKWDFT